MRRRRYRGASVDAQATSTRRSSDGTRLELIHESLPSDDSAARRRRGWTSIVEKLARRLAVSSDEVR